MGRKKGKGKSARNARANQAVNDQEQDYSKAPHSFVFHRGHVGKTVKELVLDARKIMEPYTASNLKVRKKNVMKDFLNIAGPMHVSHFIVFTKTDIATYMRLICVPKGPTLTFKINEFCLAKDVLSYQKHPDVDAKLFTNHAVMVTNIPGDTLENKLMNVTFKNMFPSINPNTVKLNDMRRTVLVNYDTTNKSIDVRHYTMKVVPTGLSRGMKKLMKTKLPNLGQKDDISDLFLDRGLSDSEAEQDGPYNEVTVPQKVKDRGVRQNSKNAIRLKEIGPRLNMQLIKIEEGFEGGNVLFHALVQKTPEELELLKTMRHSKQKAKLARKQKQEANVQKKKEKKEVQVKKSWEGMKKRKALEGENDDARNDEDDNEDDDAEYYKREVGEDPEPEVFKSRKRKRPLKEEEGPKRKCPMKEQESPNFKRKRSEKSRGGVKSSLQTPEKKTAKKKFSVKFSPNLPKGKNKVAGKKFVKSQNKVKKPKLNKRGSGKR